MGVDMDAYHLVRVWQLKEGCTGAELEELMASGYLEMQRWIPGVKHIALLRVGGHGVGRYVLTTTFASHYSKEISLAQALSLDEMAHYAKRATGAKYLINPNRSA